nr:B3 domain-containing protein Os03g0212300-like [Aegilops tauschii subsp. strangulata]
MDVEVSVAGNVFLNRGGQSFARAGGLHGICTLHFRYDSVATLYVRVFGNSQHSGCFLESDNDGDDGQLALDDGRVASGADGSHSGESTSDRPLHRRARTAEGD